MTYAMQTWIWISIVASELTSSHLHFYAEATRKSLGFNVANGKLVFQWSLTMKEKMKIQETPVEFFKVSCHVFIQNSCEKGRPYIERNLLSIE